MALVPVTKRKFFTTTGLGSAVISSFAPDFYAYVSAEVIGAGGNGRTGNGSGGGGGAYAKDTTQLTSLTSSSTLFYRVGIGGGTTGVANATGRSWISNSSIEPTVGGASGCLAEAGQNAPSGGGTGGGTATSIGDVKYAGGNGATSAQSGGGGGGAGGPGGAGAIGGADVGVTSQGGGGGGSGATLTVAGTAGSIGQAAVGGAGGASTGQTGGSGATASVTANATSPTNGGGGGGGFNAQNGGAGSPGTYYTDSSTGTTGGSGGGGGGSYNGNGGAGGLYGAGGGGSNNGSAGAGAQGLVIFTYTAIPPSITSFSPSSANDGGGSTVVITGTNFTNVTSVTFGLANATSYTVDSDTQITAVIPSGLDALGDNISGAATVTVTTIYGSGSSTFTYIETLKYTDVSSISAAPQIGELVYALPADASKFLADGYLACDGSVVSQSTYSDLYAILGRAFNGTILNAGTVALSGLGLSTTSTFNSIIYGGGIYVSGGQAGVLYTSTNAVTWTARTPNTATTINAVIYANNVYVYAQNGGRLSTSTNAITWTARSTGTGTFTLNALTYGDVFVLGGVGDGTGGGNLATSTDAITWTLRTSGTASAINTLIYAGGIYVYGGVGGVLATSTNAITWTTRTSGTTSNIRALTYGNGIYVYGGVGGVLASSTNAITWTARTSGTATQIDALTYGNNLFVFGSGLAGAGSGITAYSADGATWTSSTQVVYGAYDVVYNPTTYEFVFTTRGDFFIQTPYTYDSTTSFLLPLITNTLTGSASNANLFVKAK